MIRLDKKGDTIVEVLICVAIISLVLGASFATLNRATIQNRKAQERSEAVRFVQAQAEFLKANPPTVDKIFCYSPTGNEVTIPGGASTFPTLSDGSYGLDCSQGDESRYKMAVLRSTSAGITTYTIRARWQPIGGGNVEEVITYYKAF